MEEHDADLPELQKPMELGANNQKDAFSRHSHGLPILQHKAISDKSIQEKMGLAGHLTPSIMLVALLFDLPPLFSIGILVLTFFSLLAIYPVLIDFTSEEEHLW